jgi:hypothetical protein
MMLRAAAAARSPDANRHSLVYLKVSEWERDVFRFLGPRLQRHS